MSSRPRFAGSSADTPEYADHAASAATAATVHPIAGTKNRRPRPRSPDQPSSTAANAAPTATHTTDANRDSSSAATSPPTRNPARAVVARGWCRCRHRLHASTKPAISNALGFSVPARNTAIGVRPMSISGLSDA